MTIWDKELVLIDELNRAVPELQSKWLEIIRSRKIMGFPTQVKWVWAAMNPISYSATQALDNALVGRFAIFLYPPDVLQMDEEDRIKVATHINGDDAPSLSEWIDCGEEKARDRPVFARSSLRLGQSRFFPDVEGVGIRLRETLAKAGAHFLRLRDQMPTLAEFLAKFADLLVRETGGAVASGYVAGAQPWQDQAWLFRFSDHWFLMALLAGLLAGLWAERERVARVLATLLRLLPQRIDTIQPPGRVPDYFEPVCKPSRTPQTTANKWPWNRQ